jgi:hypothetical protein
MISRVLMGGLLLLTAVTTASGADLFALLLEESAMQWRKPEGFQEVPVEANEFLPYEKAIEAPDGALQIRYALRPLGRLSIDYNDPHGAAPDPNHIFPRVFNALTGNLSVGGNTPTREYKTEEAKARFAADWAAMSIFDVDPAFARGFKGAMLLAMHKNHVADAYIIYLFKDYAQAQALINANLATLTYAMPAKAAGAQDARP